MVGLTRDRPIKAAHRACVWGVYVKPGYRRNGVGGKLLTETLEHARRMDGVALVYLSVSERTPNAKRLYETAGFKVWGVEPDCIRYAGESAREYHLALALQVSADGAE
jgi:ribosomal protein S18 acetylase RimI-like enzyme